MINEHNEKLLNKLYFDPNHPASFGGVKRLYDHAKLIDNSITILDVKNWLSSKFPYTLYKDTHRNFQRNKIYVSYVNEQWEIDLLDYSNLSRYNYGYKFLITIIDVFSKYIYVIPIKNKSMKEVSEKFEILFKKVKPTKIRSDRGKEFDNKSFKVLCQKYNIIHFVTENQTKKCAVIERLNRTLRNKIERFLAYKTSRKYIDDLKSIVNSYNNSIHRSIGMSPIDVNENNESIIFKNLYHADNLFDLIKNKKSQKLKFEIGDTVRQKFDPKSLDKRYHQKWSDVVYKVRKVYNKFKTPQYSLELDGKDLRRRFYPEELQKVIINKNTKWVIEKRLRYRTKDNQREVLVKWRGHPNQYNSWIPLETVENL